MERRETTNAHASTRRRGTLKVKILAFILTATTGIEMWFVYKTSAGINAAAAYILSSPPTRTLIIAAYMTLLAGAWTTCYHGLALYLKAAVSQSRKSSDQHKPHKRSAKGKNSS